MGRGRLSFTWHHTPLCLSPAHTGEGPGPGKSQGGPGGGTYSLPTLQPFVGVTRRRGLSGGMT